MSRKASDASPPDLADEVRNQDALAAQALRGGGAADAQPEADNPCENRDCGFEGPWHCGCLCVRTLREPGANAEAFAPSPPNAADDGTDSDRSSQAA